MYGSYEITAGFYDRINAHVDTSAWADFIERVFAHYSIGVPSLVLDLGCGTGTLTLELARRGYDMTGVDSSPEMLTRARENADAQGVGSVLWLCQDMSAFELYGTVDAVISTCDSINYLTDRDDLRRCLSLVHNYLVPDGVFVFDIAPRGKYRHVYDRDIVFEDEDGSVFCGWHNEYSDKTRLARFYLTYFVRGEDGETWRRYDEEQRQRCYTVRVIENELARAGFEILGVFSDMSMTPLGIKDEDNGDINRIHIAARVKKTAASGNNGLV